MSSDPLSSTLLLLGPEAAHATGHFFRPVPEYCADGDRKRHHDLAVFAFDLLHHDGKDLRPMPLIERRLKLTELVARTSVPCLHLVQGFDNGAKLFKAAEQHGLEGIVSKRLASAYRSGLSRDWVKIKTAGWRDANRERWRLFEKG